jgi:hypothetical protein
MIRYFQSAFPSRLLSLFLLALVLWLPVLLRYQTAMMHWHSQYADLFFHFIPPKWLYSVVGFLFFFISALWINKISISATLISKNSYLTTFVFLLLASLSPGLLEMSPYLAATFIFVFFIQRVYRLQNHAYPILMAFDAGLLLGLVVLIFPPMVFLFVFIWMALISYRIGVWRAYVVGFLGTITPWLILLAIRFLMGRPLQPLIDLLRDYSFQPVVLFSGSWLNMGVVALVGLLVLISVMHMMSSMGQRNIRFRQHALSTLWSFLFVLILILLFNKNRQVLVLLAVAASVIVAAFLDQLKQQKWMNRVMWIVLLLILANQYYPVFYAA